MIMSLTPAISLPLAIDLVHVCKGSLQELIRTPASEMRAQIHYLTEDLADLIVAHYDAPFRDEEEEGDKTRS